MQKKHTRALACMHFIVPSTLDYGVYDKFSTVGHGRECVVQRTGKHKLKKKVYQ